MGVGIRCHQRPPPILIAMKALHRGFSSKNPWEEVLQQCCRTRSRQYRMRRVRVHAVVAVSSAVGYPNQRGRSWSSRRTWCDHREQPGGETVRLARPAPPRRQALAHSRQRSRARGRPLLRAARKRAATNHRRREKSCVQSLGCGAFPFSFTPTKTENFLCTSHPINCSILLQHLHS
jgi:hypothetical protein